MLFNVTVGNTMNMVMLSGCSICHTVKCTVRYQTAAIILLPVILSSAD